MIDNELLNSIANISAHLGPGYKVSVRNYFSGYQVNWSKPGVSVMWRDIRWDTECVEILCNSSNNTRMIEIKDLNVKLQ